MANEEYWDIDGISLDSPAYRIETLTGRSGVTNFRGINVPVHHHVGEIWRPKLPASRTLSLGMTILGCDYVTGEFSPDEQTRRDNWNYNWTVLKNTVFQTDRQIALTRRFRMNGSVIVATALAEVASLMEPQMMGRYAAKAVVDLKLADPFFYDTTATVSTANALTTPVVILNNWANTIRNMDIVLNGPLTAPVLTNTTSVGTIVLTCAGTIAGGDYIEIDTEKFTALGNGVTDVTMAFSHSGAQRFMELPRDSNSLVLSASAGSGTFDIGFQGIYL